MNPTRLSRRWTVIRAILPVALASIFAWLWCRAGKLTPPSVAKTASRFPGPDDFHDGYSRRVRDAVDGAQSTYEGVVVVTMLERSLVEKRLPARLRLARSKTDSAYHPVIHLVGHQREPRQLWAGDPQKIPGAEAYHEMILLVPFVQHESGTQWHNYAAWMYLDNIWAIWIGNSVYEYNKDLAQLDEHGQLPGLVRTLVSHDLATLYFLSQVRLRRNPEPDGPSEGWCRGPDAGTILPRFAAI